MSTDIGPTLAQTVLKALANIPYKYLDAFAQSNAQYVRMLYEKGHLTDDNIEDALEWVVLMQAALDIEKMDTQYADHVYEPRALAYAIQQDELDKNSLDMIRFDHGHTAKTYVKTFDPTDFLSELRERVLAPALATRYKAELDY